MSEIYNQSDTDRPLKSRGAGIIFHILPTDEFMFFLRDDKPTISCPGMIDIIGGHMEPGESPEEAAKREASEELIDSRTGQPFVPMHIEHFSTWVDARPGQHNIFGCELEFVPELEILEGQGLVYLSREEALQTQFAYGYADVVRKYIESH